MEKAESAEVENMEHIKLEFFMGAGNPASKYARHFVIFKDGYPEDWIKWLMAFCEIESLMPLKEPADKTKMLWTLLRDRPYPFSNIT